ncbi:M23 family metallopeptidase [Faecalispora sporosphaeroides]|uniref:M23 family metallopeptidase n=1 Tax=Faecalispora sporosphaeroides TaxID=1549 RepID=UPI00036B4B83|nr:M23 family metallopeptidase [Faecalispora sporosphaeroides]
MLDKEVIKHTRNGIQKQNLTTGATKMLTQSDFAKEIHYQRPGTTEYTHTKTPVPTDKRVHPAYQRPSKPQSFKSTAVSPSALRAGDKTKASAAAAPPVTALPRTGGQIKGTAIIRYPQSSISTQIALQQAPYISIPYLQRFQNANGRKSIQRFGRYVVRDTARELKESDSIGLQAVGEYTQDVQSAVQAYRDIHRFYKSRSYRVKSKTAVSNEIQITAARNSAVLRAARVKARSILPQVQSSSVHSNIIKVILQGVKEVLVGPGTKLFLIGGLLVILSVMLLNQAVGAFVNSFVGSTIDHPELTEYVAQLDQDFQQEINDEKEKYSDKPNTTVKIEWNGFVDTDANVLAILATKDWTVLDLTEENKAALKKYHSILNTYTVEKKSNTEQKVTEDAKVKEESSREITIRVHIYTAEEIIDSLGFTETEKNHMLEMLDVLTQISDPSSPTTGIIVTDGDGLFIWPTPGVITITSPFGERWGKMHKGIDISGYEAYGKAIVATADGVVTQAVHSGWGGGYGLCVYIDHGNGYSSRYGHCSKILVNKGDRVQKGQIIAYIGSSGDSTGPHLHFEIRKNGVPINPQQFFKK